MVWSPANKSPVNLAPAGGRGHLVPKFSRSPLARSQACLLLATFHFTSPMSDVLDDDELWAVVELLGSLDNLSPLLESAREKLASRVAQRDARVSQAFFVQLSLIFWPAGQPGGVF